MRTTTFLSRSLPVAFAVLSCSAQAVVFGGVDFPQGSGSFADSVASYDPTIVNGQPVASVRDPLEALGTPDNGYVTLGDGGSITLAFVDNRLTGSSTSGLDLWIFEIGGDVEDTFVEISRDGTTWLSVGKVFGSTSGIDLDAFGYGVADQFAFVRLTDDPNEGQQSGTTVGADIGAVGAISSVAATPPDPVPAIPEPSTYVLMFAGIAAMAVFRRRRRNER